MKRFLTTLALATFALAAQAAVDVNKASQAELEAVKGIGPGMAARILDARKQGNFADWPNLIERVRGLGIGNAARLSDHGLTVGGSAYAAAAVATAKAPSRGAAKADAPVKR